MTYEQLNQLQDAATLTAKLFLAVGAIHLALGLLRPGWVGRKRRGTVVLLTLGVWLAGLAVWGGTIGYTHSHPNGPHAVTGYLERYFAEECAKGADLPACKNDGAAAKGPGTGGPAAQVGSDAQ
jgi:hypothetical protein